jgi:mono/diheme cytochrome c family protein
MAFGRLEHGSLDGLHDVDQPEDEVMILQRTKTVWIFCLLVFLSCSPAFGETQDVNVGDVAGGAKLYRVHCAVCHGLDGSGKGPAWNSIKTTPADHRDGSIMNGLDDELLFRIIQAGCRGASCSPAMPAFGDVLDVLQLWDLVAYLRTLHLPLAVFFPGADQYVFKRYAIGQTGNQEFRDGQMERVRKVLKTFTPEDLTHTVFVLFRSPKKRTSLELVPQEPKKLAELKKENKLGYVTFLDLEISTGIKSPVALALDVNFTILKLVAVTNDLNLAADLNSRLEKYAGLGKRGENPEFKVAKDKAAAAWDKAVTRAYFLSVESANDYELEERDRSWADGAL